MKISKKIQNDCQVLLTKQKEKSVKVVHNNYNKLTNNKIEMFVHLKEITDEIIKHLQNHYKYKKKNSYKCERINRINSST